MSRKNRIIIAIIKIALPRLAPRVIIIVVELDVDVEAESALSPAIKSIAIF